MARPKLISMESIKKAGKAPVAAASAAENDPVAWIEKNLGFSLYSNQIKDIEDMFNAKVDAYNVLAVRGGGKSHGTVLGMIAFSILYTGLRVIIVAPKEKQAGRLVKEATAILKSKKCRVSKEVDWGSSSQHRIQFKNGSYIVALSGQETANVEGEHGHILIVDEAHKVPTYSITNKFGPMIGMLAFAKTIKIGVAIGKNHFYKSCVAADAVVNKCKWNEAEIFLDKPKEKLFPYRGKWYSRYLLRKMPVPYKKFYFPDRPDLHKETGDETSVLDWRTQYELEWTNDVLNFLSDEDQQLLFTGDHELLPRGIPGEIYGAGLDTAQGSLTGRKGTDETVLSIWRMRRDGIIEKVASFIWVGAPLQQKEEIWAIINPVDGLFKCKMTLVDYSNIGIDIVEMFRARKIPILGRHFGSTEPKSKKNWKNALYDYFQIQLQSEKVKYGDIKELEKRKIAATGDMSTLIDNHLRGFWEWTNLQRIRGRGINDDIAAPTDNIEGADGESERAFDDCCVSDVLGAWAVTHIEELNKEVSDKGNLSAYSIPIAVTGISVLQGPGAVFGNAQGGYQPTNPFAAAEASHARNSGVVAPIDGASNAWMSSLMTQLASKK